MIPSNPQKDFEEKFFWEKNIKTCCKEMRERPTSAQDNAGRSKNNLGLISAQAHRKQKGNYSWVKAIAVKKGSLIK